jgi:hypothetical protein
MPHLDELLGVATVAATGLFAAIALQPDGTQATRNASTRADAAISGAAAPIVRLAPVEVVARRSVELAHIEREEKRARERIARDPARPKA